VIHTSERPEPAVPDKDISSYVLERAPERGAKPALIDGPTGREIGYEQLAGAVGACASGLAGRGFSKGDVLGVYMPNLPEYAIAFHGATPIGGLCTTANPLYTAEELTHQLENSGARFLLTVPPFLDTAREAAEQTAVEEVFVLGEDEGATPFAELLSGGGEAPAVEIDPAADLAVMPYSSGTTGLAKGVMLTHRNLVANIVQTQDVLQISPNDVLIGVLPFFHIYGMTVIMNLGLQAGAKIVTMPRFELDQFLDLIEEHRVTHAFIVPPIALALAKHPAVEGRDLSSLCVVMSGAASLGAELAKQVGERIGCEVMQGYGLTETSPVTHVMPIGEGVSEEKAGTIGPPLGGTECRLVDPETGEDAAEGERGELWIRGPQVMRGYLGNPEATAATLDDDGWLHTGDIATVDDQGYFRIVDRLKELIKYKGFQVPPAELEALIITNPKVSDVAVIGVPDEECGELPKAYVVPAGEDFDAEELMSWVGEHVSPQKRIRLVETIDEVPKSASGKILRRVLIDREAAGRA